MKNLSEISFSGKKVLIRVDFNVPLNDRFEITDDSRIIAALPTIKKVLKDGGGAIIMSHLGRPKNGPENKFSLKHLQKYLSVLFFPDVPENRNKYFSFVVLIIPKSFEVFVIEHVCKNTIYEIR